MALSELEARRILAGWCICGHDPGHHQGKDGKCDFMCKCGPVPEDLVKEAKKVLKKRKIG